MIERGECHLAMRHHGRDDTNQIEIIATDERAPIIFDVVDCELARSFCSTFAMSAGNRHNLRAFAGFEARNLRRARKAGANNSDANLVIRSHKPSSLPK